jgi:hypothetical protein
MVGFLFGEQSMLIVDVNEDIPETATLADVIRAVNADRQWQREAPTRTAKFMKEAMTRVPQHLPR